MLVPFLFLIPLSFSKTVFPSGGEKESSCSYQRGDYSLSWYYDDLSSDVVFKLSAKSPFTNFWTGVLLGDDKPTDAIGVFVRSGQLGLTDGHVSEDQILADNLTDVQSLSFDLTEDKLTAEFARPLTPQDKTDADLGRCVTMFFPVVPLEIDMGSPITVPSRLEKKTICDLADSCVQRDSTGPVKREEPPLCEYKHNKQLVKWHHEKGHYIFSFEHPVKKGKWWSSIGAGDSMQEMSMAVAFADNGKVKNVGGYTSTNYAVPQKSSNNGYQVKLISSSVKNGKAHYEFSVNEKLIDEKTNPDSDCVTLQVGINSGPFTPGPEIKKHQVPPTAVTVCEINKCQNEKSDKSKPGKTTKAPKTTEAIVDAHPGENPLENLENGDDEQTVIPGGDGSVNTAAPGDSIVDGNLEIPSESAVDAHAEGKPEENESGQPTDVADALVDVKTDAADALVDVKAPDSIVDVNETPAPDSQIVDVHTSEGPRSNENIIDFKEATPDPQEQNGDSQGKREEEDMEKSTQTNETAIVDADSPLEQLIKKVQQNAMKPEGDPSESIVDFKEDTEGSGEGHIEGSGESTTNETNVGESQDQGGNSILTDLEASRPPIVNVDGAVDPKASSTFTPPVTVPQLHSDPPSVNATNAPPAAAQPASASPDSLFTVPKACENPQDLRICDGYFQEYLSKVQEWSTKHKKTTAESMTKACRLLSQVKHVPSMCCNRFKTECEIYSRQV